MMGDVVPSARLAAEEAEAPRRSSMASEEALQQLLDVAETLRTEVATRFGHQPDLRDAIDRFDAQVFAAISPVATPSPSPMASPARPARQPTPM